MTDFVNALKLAFAYTLVASQPVAGSAPVAPTLTSLNYSQGDIAGGGRSIVATGTNCLTVNQVNILGATVVPTATTAGTVTFTLPAHAAGTGTVSLTSPSGTSGTLPFEYWSPVQITGATRYFDSNKGVAVSGSAVTGWTCQISGFTGGQATPANRPNASVGVFGTIPSINFVPEQWLTGGGIAETAMSPFSVFAVVKTVSGTAGAANPTYNVARNILGGGGWSGFGLDGGKVAVKVYNSALESWGSSVADGTPHIVGITSTATPTRQGYKDGAAVGAPSSLGGDPLYYWDHIGDGYLNTDGFNGDLGAVVTAKGTVISAGDNAKLTAWAQQRFGTP